MIDPADPGAGTFMWQGRWRTLTPAWDFDPKVENFALAWEQIEFPKLLRNTAFIAVVSTIGAVGSAICVAYGFSRFRFPGRGPLFLILLSTIMLSSQVTLVPTYILFTRIGWTDTWLPLIVPHFFANAYNVFLLRQYFLTIPRDLDEAAMIDGAGPFRILRSVIVPQAIPAIVAVTLFHFFFAWNEFLLSLVYCRRQPRPLAAVARHAEVRLAVRDPAAARPGERDPGHRGPGRRVLPLPACLHARGRRHRRRQVTTTIQRPIPGRVSTGPASRARRGVAASVSPALTSGTHASRGRWSTTASGPGSRSVAWARGASGGRSVAMSRGGTSRSDSIGSNRSRPTASRSTSAADRTAT